MDLQWRDGDSEARFSGYLEHLSGCLSHAGRVAPFRILLHGTAAAGGSQVGCADGGASAPGPDVGATSIAAAFCWSIALG